jgi:dephospho-CoA kinase
MIVVGLTGSIGMGKTETGKLFAAHGWPVFDADAAVHRLYAKGGAAVEAVRERFPDAIVDGAVDRSRLAGMVLGKPKALTDLEALVHPLVRREQENFVEASRKAGREAVILDIPLLYETAREQEFDAVVVVSAPPDVQRTRVLQRPGMTEAKLESILKAQVPDVLKRQRADYVVETDKGLESAARQVSHIVEAVRLRFGKHDDSRDRSRHGNNRT